MWYLLGLGEGALHAFRHGNATAQLQAGASIVTVKENLGHAKIETTLRYTHAISGDQREAVNRLAALFERRRAETAEFCGVLRRVDASPDSSGLVETDFYSLDRLLQRGGVRGQRRRETTQQERTTGVEVSPSSLAQVCFSTSGAVVGVRLTDGTRSDAGSAVAADHARTGSS